MVEHVEFTSKAIPFLITCVHYGSNFLDVVWSLQKEVLCRLRNSLKVVY